MERGSVAVIVNPERHDDLQRLLESIGDDTDVEVVEPDSAADLAGAVRAAGERADVVAAIGGDGTQREAAHALRGTGTALAVVPGGTVNLLARVLGIASVDDAARAIVDGRRRRIDTGMLDDDTFVLNASSGYGAAVMRRVDEHAKRWGRLGYFVTGIRTLWTHRVHHAEVVIDGEPFHAGRAMTVMITNVPQRGSADFTVALGGASDDGLLDVVVQRNDTARSMARTLWALGRRRPPSDDDLVVGHGRTIDVRWSTPVDAQRDGDAIGAVTEVQCRVDPGSLRVCVPVTD